MSSPSAEILNFSSTSAQYIRMQILGGTSAGLGEVAFGVASVPEPSSVWLVFAAALVFGVMRGVTKLDSRR